MKGGRGLVQLSLRYRSDDQFWYSLFHELGHLLTGGLRQSFVDEEHALGDDAEDSEGEAAANEFARDALMPHADYGAFVAAGDFTADAVLAFAALQGIAPGIVVGRLQYDGHVDRLRLNHLKRTYEIHP